MPPGPEARSLGRQAAVVEEGFVGGPVDSARC